MKQPRVEEKAYAYVVRSDGQLLVFDHPDSQAGTQVPKGGVEPGETPREAVVREVAEEAGLVNIDVDRLIAEDEWPHPTKPKAYRRYFYRVQAEDDRDAWRHEVTGDGEDEGMVYSYFWSPPDAVSLARDMDDYVDQL